MIQSIKLFQDKDIEEIFAMYVNKKFGSKWNAIQSSCVDCKENQFLENNLQNFLLILMRIRSTYVCLDIPKI